MSQSYRTIQYNFTSGILSPMQEGAVTSQAYQAGLSIAENVFYGPGYGLFKRQGTQYQIQIQNGNKARLFTFIYKGNPYGLVFTNTKATLFQYSSFEKGTIATYINEVSTPYMTEDLQSLSIECNNDIVYIVHRKYAPRKITIVNNLLQAPATIEFVAPINPTSPTEGSIKTTAYTFSRAEDYPSMQIFHDGRWFLMSSEANPQMVWYSRSYDAETDSYRYNDFTVTNQVYVSNGSGSYEWRTVSLADLGGVYLNSDMYGATPVWCIAHQQMLVATGRTIYTDNAKTGITATTDNPFALVTALSYGSNSKYVCAMGNYVFFVGTEGCTIRCISYNQEYSTYAGADISQAVSHLLSKGVKMITVTDGQIPFVWVLTNDNILLSCYFVGSSIIAWSRITFDGNDYPECIEAIQGSSDGYCALGLVMHRGNTYTVETLEIAAPASIWQYPSVDCWKKHTGTGTISNNKRNGYKIEYIKSSNLFGSEEMKLNDTFTYSGFTCYEGYGYTMVAGTLRTELPANGTSQGAKRAIESVTLRLFNSIGGEIAKRSNAIDSSSSSKISDLIDDTRPVLYQIYDVSKYGTDFNLFTGDKSTQFSTSVLNDDRLLIISKEPYPFCISALIIKHSITEA